MILELTPDELLSTTRIRQYVRRWINEWDLKRLDPDYAPVTVVADLAVNYSVRPDLEAPEEAVLNEPVSLLKDQVRRPLWLA